MTEKLLLLIVREKNPKSYEAMVEPKTFQKRVGIYCLHTEIMWTIINQLIKLITDWNKI